MHLVCPACGAVNRVPDDKLSADPKCGSCHAPLMPTTPVALDDTSLAHYLDRTEAPILLDFWAAWCGPCRAMAPAFAAVAQERPAVRFVKVDSDATPQACARFAIRSIPTLILIRAGSEAARLSGTLSAGELRRWLDQELTRGPRP